ncbi:MAG: DUF1080 domain-containing protein [Candidatus Hydrogenedens sp.]|nr:DUF1080 domain-containing protein [Candidatus Hydrogenedens sp.]
MRRLLPAVAMMLAVAALPACAAENPVELVPDAEGYLHLFNGENLDGWRVRGSKEDFKIKDGIVRSEHGWGGQLMLFTAREFSDFTLVVEWRVSPGGNSGVFIRAPWEGWPWETAYEIQISNEQPPRDDMHCTGSLYGYTAVDPRPDETPEQWRTYEVTAKGGHISVKVDGVQAVDFEQDSQEDTLHKPLKGYIGVQDSHAGAGSWIEYRTIKLKPLD